MYFNIHQWWCGQYHKDDLWIWMKTTPVLKKWPMAFQYFSVWNLIMISQGDDASWLLPWIQTSSLICSVGGFYLAWVRPRCIHIHYLELTVESWSFVVLDLLAHQAPRWYVLSHLRPKPPASIVALLPIAIFLAWKGKSLHHLYGVRLVDILGIGACFSIVSFWERLTSQ